MRFFVLALPCVFVLLAVLGIGIVTLQRTREGKLARVRRAFAWMSYGLGASLIIWAIGVMLADLVQVAYPITMAAVGVLLIVQGWAFIRFNVG